jgi:hypothetical protein
MSVSEIEIVPIRYDGLDAEVHELDLFKLGESLQGMARVLGVVAHFAVTGEYVQKASSLDVRVLAHEEPKANCFTVQAALQFAQQQQLFQGGAGVIIAAVIAWGTARASNKTEEMRAIKDSLDKAMTLLATGQTVAAQQQTIAIDRVMQTVERLAEGLRPALRQAVEPVGRSCSVMTIGDAKVGRATVIDVPTAEAIRAVLPDEILPEEVYSVRITELDLENRTGKVRLEHDDQSRIRAEFTDPVLATEGNPYLRAFMAMENLRVRAKAVMREGELHALYISNTAET